MLLCWMRYEPTSQAGWMDPWIDEFDGTIAEISDHSQVE